ncbi:MAG: hypothetical protein NTW55_00110 [Planctomycetota bacterium]|nr:hypothetical protein [Planctomycetota bacterium]
MNKEKALTAIVRHLELCGGKPNDWYIATTNDIERCLQTFGIDKIRDIWIARELDSVEEANWLKNELIENFHMNYRDEKEQGTHVIAYKEKLSANL